MNIFGRGNLLAFVAAWSALPWHSPADNLRWEQGCFTRSAKEGESVLKRKSIRTKLVVALTLLSAIVMLLAVSGFWGLYRYQQFAKAISHRAAEFRFAHQLQQTAAELSSLNAQINKHRAYQASRSSEGLIESDLFDNQTMARTEPMDELRAVTRHTEKDQYDFESETFARTLEQYIAMVESSVGREPTRIDATNWLENLRAIENNFAILNDAKHVIPSDLTGLYESGEKEHKALAVATRNHLESIRLGMEAFSNEVRGQSRVWIGIALTCTISAFLMMGLLIAAFRSLVVKPFQTLVDGTRLVAGGQFDHRIDLGTGDELSELAEAMNEMSDRFQGALAKFKSWCTDLDRQVQERTREVIQNEQLASVGFLAAGVAHEINNPLASIAWSAESLQSRAAELTMLDSENRVVDDELYEALFTNLRRIEDEAYRCKGITEKLLDFSRLSEVRRAPTDLTELVNDVVLMVGKVGKYRCKTIRTHSTEPVIASINPQEIRQVVLNLVTNALESVTCDGAVDVYVDSSDERAVVVVQDNGCGMTNEVLRHLFEPFFTRRRDGTGTGLGLSITYRIVSQHGGSLLAQSEGENRGSRMEMHLPLSTESADSRVSTPSGWNHEPQQTT